MVNDREKPEVAGVRVGDARGNAKLARNELGKVRREA
jgi:hypothetical protein